MSKPWPPKIEAEIQRTYLSGQSQGLDEAANIIMNRSIAAFTRGNDTEAKMFRDQAEILRKLAASRRDDIEKNPTGDETK